MKALFVTLLLLVSCTRKATINKDNFGVKVSGVRMEISQLNEIPWWIGAKRKEDKVTQSISFMLEMPPLKSEDYEYLIKEKNVDSWLIRVLQAKGSQLQDLGSFLVPFRPKRHGRSTNNESPTYAGVKIYYAAAYASERMRSFNCPAFGHDKRITSMSVEGEEAPFEVSLGSSLSYREKAQEVQLTPSSFNAGNSLQGSFYLEIAPYDANKKMLRGPFKRLPTHIEVQREEPVAVASCQGAHPERD